MRITLKRGLSILTLVLAIFLCSFKVNEKENLLRTKHVDATITSSSGCSFHIVGDVHYTLLPPSITGFTGTVTLSGSCSGSYTFNKGAKQYELDNSVAEIQTDDEGIIQNINWDSGDDSVDKLLSEQSTDSQIRQLFEEQTRD